MPSADLGARSEHRVTFFRSEDYVAAHLSAFVESGLVAGETVFVIAPPARHRRLTDGLAGKGHRHSSDPALICIDAEALIQQVAPGGAIDAAAVNEVVCRIVESGPRVRVYGEVAPLLVRRGHLAAAFQLELHAHRLAYRMDVPVLCGYEVATLSRDGVDAGRIGDLHDRSVAESGAEARPSRSAASPLVLLADDIDEGREMYGDYLRYAGFRVITAGDGDEAVRVADAYVPDVILLDVRGVGGLVAQRALRADPRLRRTPIIALTAHAVEGERADLLASGFDDVVAKPCLPDRLVLAIQQVVQI